MYLEIANAEAAAPEWRTISTKTLRFEPSQASHTGVPVPPRGDPPGAPRPGRCAIRGEFAATDALKRDPGICQISNESISIGLWMLIGRSAPSSRGSRLDGQERVN